jgi:hypothetical protein
MNKPTAAKAVARMIRRSIANVLLVDSSDYLPSCLM